MINRYNPDSIAPPFSPYSQGVEVPTGARTIYVAGQVGVRPDGTVPEDMEEQTAQAFQNIQSVLREKGMDLEDLVETRTYMINKDDLPGYRAGRARVFGTGLAQPDWKIEICAIAAKE